MQIVINIDKDIYKDIIENGFIYDEDNEIVTDVIKNGTILPKGHGKLIDVEEVIKIANKTKDLHGAIWNAQTIIEADYDQIMNANTVIETDKVNCERTNCDNCVNHKYCDYE